MGGHVVVVSALTGPSSVDDAELWRRVRGGDADAFACLYDRHADRLHTYCFRRTASWDVAQDLNSIVWLEAWRQRQNAVTHSDGSLAPWLFGVARNVVRNYDRKLRRYRDALARLPASEDGPDHADLVATRLDEQQRMATVLQAIAALPQREQEVLSLSVWGELDQAEIAIALGVRVGTVKSRLSRARSRLRALEATRTPTPPHTASSVSPSRPARTTSAHS